MNMKADPDIKRLIEGVEDDMKSIVISLREVILDTAPELKEGIKYGGLWFTIEERLLCGVFIRKNHISIEFDRGTELQDPDDLLEGSGKNRRHLKIYQQEDVKNKRVEYYVGQSYKL